MRIASPSHIDGLIFLFSFRNTLDSSGSQSELLNLYRLFLLGSGKYERKLAIESEAQLTILLSVLQNNPTCLDKLEQIEMNLKKPEMLVSFVEVSFLSKNICLC